MRSGAELASVNLFVAGLSYRTAPLGLRERLAIPSRDLPDALRVLRTRFGIDEAVILSTCNRIELYAAAPQASAVFQSLVDFLSAHSRVAPEAFHPHLYRIGGEEVAAHLFRVAAGLDSMVLGESEITAQVKQAYLSAHAAGAAGPLLNRLFQKALHSAKIARSRTRIAEGQASIGSVVLALTRQHFKEQLTRCEALLWGAGKAAETTARHLIKHGIGQLWIVNRTQAKAQALASLCEGGWVSWEQALIHLAHVDLAVVCTQAPHYVIDEADLASILPARGGRPLLLIDLAVPRNIEPSLARRPGVHLYNIDDLQATAQAARAQREQERERCGELIQEQASRFNRWWMTASHKEDVPCRSVEAFSSL